MLNFNILANIEADNRLQKTAYLKKKKEKRKKKKKNKVTGPDGELIV